MHWPRSGRSLPPISGAVLDIFEVKYEMDFQASRITQTPKCELHRMEEHGEFQLINSRDVSNWAIQLCYDQLPPRRERQGVVNVLYVIGTLSRVKISTMRKDMDAKLSKAREQLLSFGCDLRFNLTIFPLDVPSGVDSQPTGDTDGVYGAAGEHGRIGNCVKAALKSIHGSSTTPGLSEAVCEADMHIFGGNEASPDTMSPVPYEPNYLAYYYATEDGMLANDHRYVIGKTTGLGIFLPAVAEALARGGDWTGGKVLQEWFPDVVKDHADWHAVVGPEATSRSTWMEKGYSEMPLPLIWFFRFLPWHELHDIQTNMCGASRLD